MTGRFRHILWVVAASLLVLELGLRLSGRFRTYSEVIGGEYHTYYGDQLNHAFWGWSWPPNDTFTFDHGEFTYAYHTNRWGRRDRPLSEARTTNDRKVVVFGDSFTEGVGAPEDSTWVRSLERSIQAAGLRWMAINAGMSGSDPVLDGIAFESRYRALDPDLVVQVVNRTDYEDCVFRGGRERLRADSTIQYRSAPWFHPFYRFSHLVRGVLRTALGMDELLVPRSRRRETLTRSVSHIAQATLRMDSICRADDVDFLVVHFPTGGDVDPDDPFPELSRALIEATPELRHITIAPDAVGDHPLNDRPIAWPIDGHYNGRGYTLLGDVIFDEIMVQHPDFFALDSVP